MINQKDYEHFNQLRERLVGCVVVGVDASVVRKESITLREQSDNKRPFCTIIQKFHQFAGAGKLIILGKDGET